MANGGTVFLDEIGELPLPLQAKLLRVLEDNVIRAVGSTRVRRIDLRFIAATNRNLDEQLRQGTFRKDLYYRLAIIPIAVPALRDRPEDIPSIARHLLARSGHEMGKPDVYFEPSAMDELGFAGAVADRTIIPKRAPLCESAVHGSEGKGAGGFYKELFACQARPA
jgi:transcriptional regulator with PAS, ATPase and Fis domain